MAAFLWQVGRREVDGDAACGEREAGGDQRGADALARLGDRFVGEANDMEGGQSWRDLDLHVDRASLDPLKGNGGNPRDHTRPLLSSIEASGTQRKKQEH